MKKEDLMFEKIDEQVRSDGCFKVYKRNCSISEALRNFKNEENDVTYFKFKEEADVGMSTGLTGLYKFSEADMVDENICDMEYVIIDFNDKKSIFFGDDKKVYFFPNSLSDDLNNYFRKQNK